MLITNATSKKLRFSIFRDISEDEREEKFAYIIAKECSLNIPEDDNFTVSEENE